MVYTFLKSSDKSLRNLIPTPRSVCLAGLKGGRIDIIHKIL